MSLKQKESSQGLTALESIFSLLFGRKKEFEVSVCILS